MAIFGKAPTRKPAAAPRAGRKPGSPGPRVVSARELAAAAGHRSGRGGSYEPLGESSLRGASIIDWSTAPGAIEVQETNPGLCDVLENAALLFASGQEVTARGLLEQAVQADADTRQSALAWLALFDLMQRAGDRAAFEQLAMQYVLQFESSAPSWDESAPVAAGEAARGGGYIAVAGELSAAGTGALDGLRRAIDTGVRSARIDFSSLGRFDDAGARQLAGLLARARREQMALGMQRAERLVAELDAAVARGREGGEGAWLLSLELLQWQRDQAKFDERALDFAVAFEVSPPSWEPPAAGPGGGASDPVVAPSATGADARPAAGETVAASTDDADALELRGVVAGAAPPQLAAIEQFGALREVVTVDMTRVDRVDFVAAGALVNTIGRLEGRQKALQIAGATPIVRALLLLIGVSPRHFVRRVA